MVVDLNADWADEIVARTFGLKPDSVGYAQLWYCLTHGELDYPSLIRAFLAQTPDLLASRSVGTRENVGESEPEGVLVSFRAPRTECRG